MEALIDCDIHPLVRGGRPTLDRYMTTAEARACADRASGTTHGDTARPVNRYMNPAPGIVRGALRRDAVPPTGEAPGTDPEFVVTDLLDRWGAEAALMIPLPYGIWLDPLSGGSIMAAMSRYFIEEWLTVDPRFKLAAGIFALDADAAAKEIRAYAEIDRVVGVFMPLLGMLMGHPHYDPIYRAASECDLPIVVHPSGAEGTYPVAPALAGGLPTTYVERHVALPQVAQSNLASLVLSGVFERFPNLKVVFAEYGFSWVAPLMWRMDREVGRANWSGLKRNPISYVLEHVRYCTQPVEEPDRASDMGKLIKMMRGETTLMFSTDYPHWDTDNPMRIFAALDDDVRNRVFADNARETFAGRL